MAWTFLIVAGLLEVAWAAVLPSTHGLTRLWPTAAFLVLLAGSMAGLARATQALPLGTAYAVWVGIGTVGTALVGTLRGEPLTPLHVLCLGSIVGGVVGLRALSGS